MSERIEKLVYRDVDGVEIKSLKEDSLAVRTDPYFNGPAEYLVGAVTKLIKATKEFSAVFGEYVDPYRRMDYPIRAFPAVRIYNELYTKEFDSWFIVGDLKLDVIWPASLRRVEQQQFPDTVASALLQQFRRPTFFDAVSDLVPGLNELGKTFNVDKSLGFEWQDDILPLTQITVNFRLDLRQWDLYLEATNRTKDTPFEETLAGLARITSDIQALRDDTSKELDVNLDQKI